MRSPDRPFHLSHGPEKPSTTVPRHDPIVKLVRERGKELLALFQDADQIDVVVFAAMP